MVRSEVSLCFSLLLVYFRTIDCRDCGDIIIRGNVGSGTIFRSYERCTRASLLYVIHTKHYHLRLSNLEIIEAKNSSDKVKLHSSLIVFDRNINMKWSNASLPKLRLIKPLQESLLKSNTVSFISNYPFRYTKKLENKLLTAGVNKKLIKIKNSRNTCWVNKVNGKIVGDENCDILRGPVNITGPSMNLDLIKRLRKVTTLYGWLYIDGSNLRNLDFIANISKISCHYDCPEYAIEIKNNALLSPKKFPFKYLKTLSTSNKAVRIVNNPWWRIQIYTEDYFQKILTQGVAEVIVELNACKLNSSLPAGAFDTKELNDCLTIKGDIIINENTNLKEVGKFFNNLQHLDGCLTIKNTEITVLDFFADLKTVNCTKQRDAVIIQDNDKLRTMIFSFTKVYAQPGYQQVSLILNLHLCEEHKDYFLDNLEHVDGPPRVYMKMFSDDNYCLANIDKQPKSLYTLLILTLSLLIIPPGLWISIECCKNRKRPKNSHDRA